MRELKVRKLQKQLRLQVSQLEELGVEIVLMSYDCLSPSPAVTELSSRRAGEFIESTGISNKFGLYLTGEAGGSGRLPYMSLVAGKVKITAADLPDALNVRKPSIYGRQQLLVILQKAKDISFEVGKFDNCIICMVFLL
ncbi:hypothetical protein AOXY_G12910 [Acipenser oxyrinchus oxyrinchus]|uniref:Uncharacterized protein n=1 Tax=Acipenser oxyrinchus oxyrinchus TaxID=40147 RepID=A0AAD8DCR3_ACIOX|nr:hypothetical protein AOXY_G12910 [Acipenser oxyrinchus oxyrinchus]